LPILPFNRNARQIDRGIDELAHESWQRSTLRCRRRVGRVLVNVPRRPFDEPASVVK
jgi:hypothetical protein